MTKDRFESLAQALAQGYLGTESFEDGTYLTAKVGKSDVMLIASHLCEVYKGNRFNAEKFKARVWELMNQ